MDSLARMLIIITALIMTFTGALLFFFPAPVMGIFTKDAKVIALGVTVLKMVAISEPIYGALIMLEGIFNGVGATKITFLIGVITMWIVRVGATYVVVHVLHLGLNIVWCCMIADNVCKAIILGVFFKRGLWKKYAATYN